MGTSLTVYFSSVVTGPKEADSEVEVVVDVLVVDPNQWQTYATQDNPAYSGHLRIALSDIPRLPAGPRRVIARRGAMEPRPPTSRTAARSPTPRLN